MCTNIEKRKIKLLKTITIFLSNLTLGLAVSITGPCFLDLQRLVKTDIQHIAFIYTSRSVGYLVGAILGGVVLDLVRSKMSVITVCSLFATIVLFGIPWSRNVEILLGFAVVYGLALGAIETGSNVVIIQLWGSGFVLQSYHFTFGLGSLIAPLIAAPFLEDPMNLPNLSTTSNYSSDAYFAPDAARNLSFNAVHRGIPKITYPFSILGIIALLVTVLFFVTSLLSPYEDSGSRKKAEDNADKSFLYMFSILFFSFLLFFVLIGTEIGFGQVIAPYAVKGKLQISPVVASYMTSTYWTAFTITRLVCAFLSIRFSNMTLLASDICLITVAGVMFLFFMPSEGILWALTIVYGIGTASAYALIFGWLDEHITITNKISAMLSVSCAAGEMVIPFVIAFFMETVPEMLAYVIAADSIVSAVLLLVLHAISRKGERKEPAPKEIECYVITKEAAVN